MTASAGTSLVLVAAVGTLIFFVIILVIAVRTATADERGRVLRTGQTLLHEVKAAAALNREKCEPFHEALRSRVPLPLLTPALVALNAIVLVAMIAGDTPLHDPETWLQWGGNYGPSTTNGGWWRLLASIFVHGGIFHLAMNTIGLLQVGLLLERLVGRLTLGLVYVSAGIFASLVSALTVPISVSIGASGAIFGLYGLLAAWAIWSGFNASELTIPRVVWKRLTPAATIFFVYSLFSDSLSTAAELAGLVTGLVCGLVLTKDVNVEMPDGPRVAATSVATLIIAALAAVPLRGVTDVRPEIEKLVQIEQQTVKSYEVQLAGLKKRKTTTEALAFHIESSILPELQSAQERFDALNRVPPEHKPLVANATEYLRLRSESWRLRAAGLRGDGKPTAVFAPRAKRSTTENARRSVEARHTANMLTLGSAEIAERGAREALAKITPAPAERSER